MTALDLLLTILIMPMGATYVILARSKISMSAFLLVSRSIAWPVTLLEAYRGDL